jgi:ATP-dependent DNA helicase RecQ
MSFETLQVALASWPAVPGDHRIDESGLSQRVSAIVGKSQRSAADLLPLLRHALSRESARRGRPAVLRVPFSSGWPSPEQYDAYGLIVVSADATHVVVEAKPWQPEWLGHVGDGDLLADVFAERLCRPDMRRSIDPVVQEATGFDTYHSPGQRAAVHAVLMAPRGTTLVVTLPTGSGKSLVAQAPPLLAGEGACTVVVVPTVALALDQARQFEALWRRRHPHIEPGEFAWHADTAPQTKQRIKEQMRSGRQPILFTSPESLMGALRFALFDTARAGFLKYFVVDEAHLVAQWGDAFRPEFQSLGALRRALMKVAPQGGFTTVLMTATLAAEALATLETLFNDGRPAELVAGVHLRTEPRFWFARAADAREQKDRVLEVIRHAPRPLILYTTEVEKAKDWARCLQLEGMRRIGLFHGETGSAERERLVDAWAKDEIDVMVATSAFGVGIDKRNVRCVVHSCVPESLDRFYQEVGRGGRDGHASVSITIYTEEDVRTAEGIAAPAIVTTELGLARWEAMLRGARPHVAGEGTYELDLATVAPGVHRTSDYNRAWNLRTIMLLVRAGVIELATAAPLTFADATSELEPSEDDVRRIFDTVVVRLRRPEHRSKQFWDLHVEQSRQATFSASRRGLERLKNVLGARSELSHELKELYSLPLPGRSIIVAATCPGCPLCRAAESAGEVASPLRWRSTVRPMMMTGTAAADRWFERFPTARHSPVLIHFDAADPQLETRIAQLALRLRDWGLQELHLNLREFPGATQWPVLKQFGAGFVALTNWDDEEEELTPVPRLSVLRRADLKSLESLLYASPRAFEWVAFASDTADPQRLDRRLAEVRECINMNVLLQRLI